MTETLRHREAFEFYYRLGDIRSLGLVAGEYRVSEKTAAAWSKQFGWQQRVLDRDSSIAERIRAQTDDDVVAERARIRAVLRVAVADFAEGIEDGRIRVTTVADFERLVKLGLLLDGEATETVRHQHDWEEVVGLGDLHDDELGQRLAQSASLLARRVSDNGAGAASCDVPSLPRSLR